MADCKAYTHLISAAVDGELNDREQAQLDAHLAQCPQCRALMDELSQLHQTLAQLPPVQPPPQLKDHIMAAVAQHAAPRRDSRWAKGLACAAVAALVLTAAWQLGIPTPMVGSDAAPQNETAVLTAETAEDDAALDEGGEALLTGAARDFSPAAAGGAETFSANGDAADFQDDVVAATVTPQSQLAVPESAPAPAQKASAADASAEDTADGVAYAVQINLDAPVEALFQIPETEVYSITSDAQPVTPDAADPLLPPP